MDGARLWNACTASGRSPADVARPADTVMVCYSKGLGAPVGSALAGPADFMEEAWRVRRRLGGSMRQSGIVAAGALHALDRHRDRVAEDHQNAALLAASLAGTPGLGVVPPETHVVMIDLQPGSPDPEAVLAALRARGVLLTPFGGRRIRAVTHMDVDSAGVVRAADVLREVLGAAPEAAPRRPAPA
jgi:threonine aldolase